MELRVLIIDDSLLFRQVIKEILTDLDHVEVIGTASNGSIGLKKVEQQRPDVVTLDVEMPIMDGLQTLPQIKQEAPNTDVIMISSLTKAGAATTIKALSAGALDFIEKPDEDDPDQAEEHLRRQLKRIINMLVTKKILATDGKAKFPKAPPPPSESLKKEAPPPQVKQPKESTEAVLARIHAMHGKSKVEAVGIGVSTGGPGALPVFLKNLPLDLNVPIFIVQHMPPLFVSALVESLNKNGGLPVVEAEHESPPQPNTVYMAPGGKQMKVIKKPGALSNTIVLTDDPPENYCKPAVDYLFRSLAETYEAKVLGIIMTGMGKDGTAGAKNMRECGATIYGQDQASSVVFGMAQEAQKAGVINELFPLDQLADAVTQKVKGNKS